MDDLHLRRHPQGPNARLERPTFTVLREEELPRPGMVFGIDAEFVAVSRPDKVLQGWAHPRARASVLAAPP